MADLKGKVGVVTGSSSGIGKATVLAMAKAGATLVLGSQDAAKNEEVIRIMSLYCTAKHAVTGMTKAAALDYAKRGIRVNAVGPGPIETSLLMGDPNSYAAFVPMGRTGKPEEIAAAVVWLLSDEASFVTGHTLPVDGGVCAQ